MAFSEGRGDALADYKSVPLSSLMKPSQDNMTSTLSQLLSITEKLVPVN